MHKKSHSLLDVGTLDIHISPDLRCFLPNQFCRDLRTFALDKLNQKLYRWGGDDKYEVCALHHIAFIVYLAI